MSYNPQNPNGQATSANSSPVVIASDQSAMPVSGTLGIAANSSVNVNQVGGTAVDTNSGSKSAGTQRVVIATDQPQLTNALKVDGSATTQPVSGTVSVSGVATAANQSTEISSLSSIQTNTTNIPAKGSATMANSTPVNIASDQTVPVSAASLPLPSGAATAANQTTANTSLSSIVTNTANIPAKGQATMANSTPVTMASDQSTINVTTLPNTTGGWSVNSQTALSNTKVTVKASAGTFGGYMLYNPNAAVSYVQVFDVSNGSVTLGTTTPTYVIPLPPAAGANVEFGMGINHTTAIVLAATTTATGSTAPSSALTGFFLFK